eukprot:g17970.t1
MDPLDPKTETDRRLILTHILEHVMECGRTSDALEDAIRLVIINAQDAGDPCDRAWGNIVYLWQNWDVDVDAQQQPGTGQGEEQQQQPGTAQGEEQQQQPGTEQGLSGNKRAAAAAADSGDESDEESGGESSARRTYASGSKGKGKAKSRKVVQAASASAEEGGVGNIGGVGVVGSIRSEGGNKRAAAAAADSGDESDEESEGESSARPTYASGSKGKGKAHKGAALSGRGGVGVGGGAGADTGEGSRAAANAMSAVAHVTRKVRAIAYADENRGYPGLGLIVRTPELYGVAVRGRIACEQWALNMFRQRRMLIWGLGGGGEVVLVTSDTEDLADALRLKRMRENQRKGVKACQNHTPTWITPSKWSVLAELTMTALVRGKQNQKWCKEFASIEGSKTPWAKYKRGESAKEKDAADGIFDVTNKDHAPPREIAHFHPIRKFTPTTVEDIDEMLSGPKPGIETIPFPVVTPFGKPTKDAPDISEVKALYKVGLIVGRSALSGSGRKLFHASFNQINASLIEGGLPGLGAKRFLREVRECMKEFEEETDSETDEERMVVDI